jgi:hypothetical protein
VQTTTEGREITAVDRCDTCGAPAKVVATFLNGELLFCGHHAREAGTNLVLKALHVYDPDGEFNLIH